MGKAKLAWFPCEPLCPLWLRRSLPQRAQGSQGKTKQNIELRNFAPTNSGALSRISRADGIERTVRGRPRHTHAGLLRGFGEDGGVGYSGGGGIDGDGSAGRRKRIELGCRSRGAGDVGIGVGESASGTAVVKGNAVAGNGIAILV